MLLEYPLVIKYDSAVVLHSLNTIKKYKLAEQKENAQICKIWLPILTEYKKYYKSIFDLFNQILKIYLEFDQPYSMDLFKSDLDKTSYYKNCYNKGYNVKFLDAQISEVETFIRENRLTKGNIQDVLDNMR